MNIYEKALLAKTLLTDAVNVGYETIRDIVLANGGALELANPNGSRYSVIVSLPHPEDGRDKDYVVKCIKDDGNGGLSLCSVEYKPYVCATEYEKWEILGTWFPLKKYCDIPQVAKAVVAISMELPNYISEETAVVG